MTDNPNAARLARRDVARPQLVTGLREVAEFLAEHPDLPATGAEVRYFVDVYTEPGGRRAEVERIAALLGVEPHEGTHLVVSRTFGGVRYEAVSCNPGPKPGMCLNCTTNPVRRPDLPADNILSRFCGMCLGLIPSEACQ